MSWKRVAKLSLQRKNDHIVFTNSDIPGIIELIKEPLMSVHTSFNTWLKKCSRESKVDILERGVLEIMLNGLTIGNSSKLQFGDAILQLQMIQGIKSILNNQTGMEYLIERNRDLLHELGLGKFSLF